VESRELTFAFPSSRRVRFQAANLFLIHAITTVCEELDVRVHLRAQMEACGVKRIIAKLKDFGHSSMDRIILQIETEEQDDARELARDYNQDLLRDMSNPHDIFNAILASVQGTRAHDFFLSSMQHLLLIRDDDDETRMRYFQLIDQLITSVVLDQKVGAGAEQDFSALMGVSVAKVVSRFADQDRLDKALAQASEMRATAQQLALEKAAVEEELRVVSSASSGSAGGAAAAGDRLALSQLTDKFASSEEHLKNSRLATKKLEADLIEMKRMYEERIASLELRIQELFNMLRESRGLENVVSANSTATANGGVGAIDREALVANLERQHEIKRTIEKLEGGYRNRKAAKSGLGGGTPEENGAFDDDDEEEEDEEFSSEVASTVKAKKNAGAGKSTSARRAEVKSGSQFIDAEEERVREHIEASLAANLDKLVSPLVPLSFPLLKAHPTSPPSFLHNLRTPLDPYLVPLETPTSEDPNSQPRPVGKDPISLLASSRNSTVVDSLEAPRLLPSETLLNRRTDLDLPMREPIATSPLELEVELQDSRFERRIPARRRLLRRLWTGRVRSVEESRLVIRGRCRGRACRSWIRRREEELEERRRERREEGQRLLRLSPLSRREQSSSLRAEEEEINQLRFLLHLGHRIPSPRSWLRSRRRTRSTATTRTRQTNPPLLLLDLQLVSTP